MSPGETFQNIYDSIGCLPEIPYNFNLCNSPSIAISKETAIGQFGGMLHIEEIEEEVVNISENENESVLAQACDQLQNHRECMHNELYTHSLLYINGVYMVEKPSCSI